MGSIDSKSLPDRVRQLMAPEERKAKQLPTNEDATRKACDKSEKEMQATIEAFCRQKGWPCYRSRMDRKSTMPVGTPDFLICINGRFVALECKQPPNRPTEEQSREIVSINLNDGTAIICESSAEAIDTLISINRLTNPTK